MGSITIVAEVKYFDGTTYYRRTAPQLPNGAFWQIGMHFCDTQPDTNGGFEIDEIYVNPDGSVELYIVEDYGCESSEDIDNWLKDGWELRAAQTVSDSLSVAPQ